MNCTPHHLDRSRRLVYRNCLMGVFEILMQVWYVLMYENDGKDTRRSSDAGQETRGG